MRINNSSLQFSDNGNGAVIERVVNLSGVSSATLSFNYSEFSFDNGETVQVSISKDGTTFHNAYDVEQQQRQQQRQRRSAASISRLWPELSGQLLILRFEVFSSTSTTGGNNNNGTIPIDNVNIDVIKPVIPRQP